MKGLWVKLGGERFDPILIHMIQTRGEPLARCKSSRYNTPVLSTASFITCHSQNVLLSFFWSAETVQKSSLFLNLQKYIFSSRFLKASLYHPRSSFEIIMQRAAKSTQGCSSVCFHKSYQSIGRNGAPQIHP